MGGERERMESSVRMSDFSPLREVLENVPAEEVAPSVPGDVQERAKVVSDQEWEEGLDEVFPEKKKKTSKCGDRGPKE